MNIVEQAEIHFHEQEKLSVFLESNSADDFEKAGEIGLLTMFALRMMSNLDVCETTDNLAKFLIGAEAAVPALAAGTATGGFQLVPYPGQAGRKQFNIKFHLTANQLRFDLDYKGFGWFSTGMGYYGPIAVIGLLRQLAVKRAKDPEFHERLARAAVLCGQAQLARKITLQNQSQLGFNFLNAVCAAYLTPQPDAKDQVVVQSNASSADDAGDFKWPTELGDASDDMFPLFGEEFDSTLGRSDGREVARRLYGFLFHDEQVWFYERVWPYFSAESSHAELWCRRAIGFFQALRSQDIACERGWIPMEKRDWYLDWLLRLLGGEQELQRSIYEGKLTAEYWLPRYEAIAGQPRVVMSATMAALLEPKGQGLLSSELTYLLSLFIPTLDSRAEATTAFAFGDEPFARETRKDAVQTEQALTIAVQQLATGGGTYHVLETHQGLLVSRTKEGGTVLYIWTEEQGAQRVNSTRLRGTHQVAPISFRELENQVGRMMAYGLRYVDVDNTMNGPPNLVPAEQFHARLRQTIVGVDGSPIVKMIRAGMEDMEKTRSRSDA